MFALNYSSQNTCIPSSPPPSLNRQETVAARCFPAKDASTFAINTSTGLDRHNRQNRPTRRTRHGHRAAAPANRCMPICKIGGFASDNFAGAMCGFRRFKHFPGTVENGRADDDHKNQGSRSPRGCAGTKASPRENFEVQIGLPKQCDTASAPRRSATGIPARRSQRRNHPFVKAGTNMTKPIKVAMAKPKACRKFLARLEAKRLTSEIHAAIAIIANENRPGQSFPGR